MSAPAGSGPSQTALYVAKASVRRWWIDVEFHHEVEQVINTLREAMRADGTSMTEAEAHVARAGACLALHLAPGNARSGEAS